MDSLTWFTLPFLLLLLFCFKFRNRRQSKLPPGPPGWPLIGNIFDVGAEPHQNFHKLQFKYGPLLWMKLGGLNALVVQSATAAAELFKNHDLAFADRQVPDSLTACDYSKGSMATAPYNEHWRVLRRLSSSELLLQKRINAAMPVAKNCIDKMIQWIKEDASGSTEIEIGKYLMIMSFNQVSNFMLSRDIMDLKSVMGNKFYEAIGGYMSWIGRPNVVDSFGFLRWLDPQGIRSNTASYLQKLLKIASGFVKERIHEKKQGSKNETRDFLDALLEYEGDGKGAHDHISEKNVTVIILEMFFGGTETSSNTTQWAMAELLRHPETMRKLKAEVDQVVGRSRTVDEGDLNDLPYLHAVIKETMRLHPALPFLLPRKARQDTEFMGYNIPKNTMVMINAWAIHRNPESWEDPYSFKPERFLNSNIDYKGQHYELIPFGSGRRSCVGMMLGEKMVTLTLARLIQSFDWELPINVSPETLDMREQMGLSLRMLTPLKAVPRLLMKPNQTSDFQ